MFGSEAFVVDLWTLLPVCALQSSDWRSIEGAVCKCASKPFAAVTALREERLGSQAVVSCSCCFEVCSKTSRCHVGEQSVMAPTEQIRRGWGLNVPFKGACPTDLAFPTRPHSKSYIPSP